MTITSRIDDDIKSLRRYFEKLFILLKESVEENRNFLPEIIDVESIESQKTFFHIDHFIKPDMVINIYSLVDFWLKEICSLQKKRKNLNLSYKDIKGDNDLHVFQKYLTKVVGLDLTSVNESYKHLDNLRIVRNKFIHTGGHVLDETEQKKIENIKGIKIGGTSIFIDDKFIWDSLDHTKKYLFETAKF